MWYPTRWLAGWLVLRLTLAPAAGSPAWADPLPGDPLSAAAPAGDVCFSPDAWRDAAEPSRRYLESMARANRSAASVRGFVRSLLRPGPDPAAAADGARAAQDLAAMLSRAEALRRDPLADPALARAAQEEAERASRVGEACREAADQRVRWIRLGAAGVTGLVGAAGVVVASGATGTLGGGVVIAAALEASLGAYLMYHTERTGEGPLAQAEPRRTPPELPDEEKRRFRAPDDEADLRRGRAGQDEAVREMNAELALDPARGEDPDGGEGEGEEGEEEEGMDEEVGPRDNHLPPILPPGLPDELMELPPLLDPERASELPSLSLAEAQQRLDEFLALREPGADPWSERPAAPMRSAALEQLIEEARAALELWKERRELAEGFGDFFVRAEVEEVPESRRSAVLAGAGGRLAGDQAAYRSSRGLEELRERIAERLVTHCRSEGVRGDLVLAACTDPTALTILVVAAVRHSGVALPGGSVLGVQALGGSFHPVLFFPASREVLSLIDGARAQGVAGPLYHPASFYFTWLVEHGVRPDIDPERHLLIAPADPGMETPAAECGARERRGLVGRVVDWFRSLVGAGMPSRRGNLCPGTLAGAREAAEAEGSGPDGDGEGAAGGAGTASDDDGEPTRVERRGVSVTIAKPRVPSPRSGGGQSGGGGQGGGSAGGGESGGSAGGGGAGSGKAEGGTAGDQGAARAGGQGEGSAQGAGEAGKGGAGSRGGSGGKGGGTARSGEGGPGTGLTGSGTDLAETARETVALRDRHRDAGPLRVRPWRLREDYGYVAPSARVLFADNPQALSRFEAEEAFITLSPSEDEAQRRMLEADSFPVFPAGTGCDARGLPPRRVFRRAAPGEPGFRYAFCDGDESTVIFRDREDARTYAALGAPDRPLYMVRLASERLARLERSEEIAQIRAFLADPNVLRELSTEEVDSMVAAAGALLTFQQTLESALVQSMEELEGSGVRPHYFEMHRQVLQGPLFVSVSEAAYRMNRRLASDPLLSLAWANALPPETRQGFFHLYYLFGSPVRWPDRWEVLRRRYGGASPPAVAHADGEASLDFLQILSDPTRVRVDWRAEPRPSRASVRDRVEQKGRVRSPEERPDPSEAEELERQERTERTRGGTRGLGLTGEGRGIGPEKGRQPLQMIAIRITPEEGDPERPRTPADNPTRPGGTRGKKKVAEESATLQEPVLWVAPQTFVDGVLSAWDRRRPRPEAADRVPPLLRFDQRLRELFRREMDRDKSYDGRILGAMTTFTAADWLRYAEVRSAMGGTWVRVRAVDTGRFAAKYARTAPIRDQDQIRGPNFFVADGVVIPADLLEPLRERYAPGGSAIFDLSAQGAAGAPLELRDLPPAADDPDGAARASLLRSLELIREQGRDRDRRP